MSAGNLLVGFAPGSQKTIPAGFFNGGVMTIFTDTERVKALNNIIKKISKLSDWEFLDLLNYLQIENEIEAEKLPLVGRE